MATKGKKQKITVDGTKVKVEYPTIKKSLAFDTAEFSAEVKFEAMMHGFKQKYGDAESGGTPADKFAMASRILEAHRAGEWDVGAGARDNSAIVAEAVSRIKGLELAAVTKVLESLDEEKRAEKVKEWASNAKVKAEVATIRAERAQAAADEAEEDEDDITL